jgi:hypothetical protein
MDVAPFISRPNTAPFGEWPTMAEREKPRRFGDLPHLRRIGLSERGLASTAFAQMISRVAGRATVLSMTNPNKFADRRPPKAAFVYRGCRGWRAALSSFAMFALTGCGLSDGAGALFVDPGRYTLYHCDDLAARRKLLIARENELRGLIERAGESPGGAVIGSFAYRSDYDSVIAEEKLLQRNAAEKNCSFASPLQSDQTIR